MYMKFLPCFLCFLPFIRKCQQKDPLGDNVIATAGMENVDFVPFPKLIKSLEK